MKEWVVVALLSVSIGASAEVYRWVDNEGNTHYGDRVPQRLGDKADKLNISNTPSTLDPEAEAARQKLHALEEGRQRERIYVEQKAAEQQQRDAKLGQHCKELARDIRSDRETAVMFSYDETGNRVVWSAEKRVAYTEKLRNLKQQYCADFAE